MEKTPAIKMIWITDMELTDGVISIYATTSNKLIFVGEGESSNLEDTVLDLGFIQRKIEATKNDGNITWR